MRWLTELSGNWITIWGVVITIVGMAVAGFGTFKTTADSEERARQAEEKNDKQTTALAAKADQVIELSTQLASKSDDIARLSQENAQLSRNLAAFTTGADSYFYLHPRNFGILSHAAMIEHVGSYPVRDTEVTAVDVTAQVSDLVAGRARSYDLSQIHYRDVIDVSDPRSARKKLARYPFQNNPERDRYAYVVQISGLSFTLRQVVQFVKINDEWKLGYIVERVNEPDSGAPRFELLHQYFDEGFPTTGDVIVKPRQLSTIQ